MKWGHRGLGKSGTSMPSEKNKLDLEQGTCFHRGKTVDRANATALEEKVRVARTKSW